MTRIMMDYILHNRKSVLRSLDMYKTFLGVDHVNKNRECEAKERQLNENINKYLSMRNNKINKTCMYLDRVVMKPIRLQSNNLQKQKESLQ